MVAVSTPRSDATFAQDWLRPATAICGLHLTGQDVATDGVIGTQRLRHPGVGVALGKADARPQVALAPAASIGGRQLAPARAR